MARSIVPVGQETGLGGLGISHARRFILGCNNGGHELVLNHP